MVKPELGTKRLCPTCGGKFYDLRKTPAECPYCEAVFNPDDLVRGKRAARSVAEDSKPVEKKPPKKKEAVEDDENLDDIEVGEVDTDDDDDDDDDDILEDASDLGEDEEDVAEVLDKVERPEGGD